MINMVGWFLIIICASFFVKQLYHVAPRGIRGFLNVLCFIGVFIHELGHAIMSTIFGVPIDGFSVRYYFGEVASPNGYVSIPYENLRRTTFLQNVMICFGPLVFSTWLFLFCLDIFTLYNLDIVVGIIVLLFMLSLAITASPSGQDFKMMIRSYSYNPSYSTYQVGLVLFTFIIVYFSIDFSFLQLPIELLYYILEFCAIVIFYFTFKYIFRLLYFLFRKVKPKKHLDITKMTRKRNRPYHHQKIGIEDEL